MNHSPSQAASIAGCSAASCSVHQAPASDRPDSSASSRVTRRPLASRNVENIDSPDAPNWMQSFQSAARPCTSPLGPRCSRLNDSARTRWSKTVSSPASA